MSSTPRNTPSSQPPSGRTRRDGLTPAAASGSDLGWSAVGSLFSGIIVWSLIGWGLDTLLGTRFCLPVGVLLGAGLGIYLIVTKYGQATTSTDEVVAAQRRRRVARL